MTLEEEISLKELKKSIPKFKVFNKSLEQNLLKKFDEENDAFEFVKKYSREYYQIREFLVAQLFSIFNQQYYFSRHRANLIKKYNNYKTYLEDEIEST